MVNNAGILRDGIFHRMSADDWLAVISVHLNGSFFVSRAAAEHFRKQESGAFVHITSTSGLIGNVGQANYAAAKLGITALSKSIALDMQRYNVRSNCLSPWAWSRMTSSIPATTPEQKAAVEKLQRMTPDKNAPLAVFLASDAAKGVTGQVFGTRMNEIYLFSSPRPDPHRASRRGLDAGDDRAACDPGGAGGVHAAGYLGAGVSLGIRSEAARIIRTLFGKLDSCRRDGRWWQGRRWDGNNRWQNNNSPRSIAEMPAQRPAAPRHTEAEARGRFFNTGNGFNVQLPPVPDHIFTDEPAKALDPATPTGLIACDISAELACRFPATTPLVLARYAKIRAGESLTTDFVASGTIAYVMTGSGTTQCAGQEICLERGRPVHSAWRRAGAACRGR